MQQEIELPYNLEAERAVLGAVLIDNDSLILAMEKLLPVDFFLAANQIIFEVMTEIAVDNEPVDPITLGGRLQRKKQLGDVGGPSYIAQLAGSVPTAANIDHYAGIVRELSLQRQVKTKAIQLSQTEDKDAAGIIAAMEESAAALSDRAVKGKEFHMIKDVAQQSFEIMEQRYYAPSTGGITGIPSGFTDLDRMTSGFQRSDLIIVAARPSVGKTAFALNIAQNVGIRAGETVAIFSLEMSASQLVQRMICAEGNVDAGRVRTGYLEGEDWQKITLGIGALSEANIFIDDSPAITVNQIRAKCRRLKKEHGLGMILIDYLQLISGSGKRDNRQQEVSEISRTLKQIARELDVPVIALSQLSRGVEQRQDKRPMMSDIRESGSIEQDADIVAFLYRDDYYEKDSEKKNIIEIIIAKQRNGPVGTVELAFLKNYNKFVNLDRSHQEITPKPPTKDIEKRQWA